MDAQLRALQDHFDAKLESLRAQNHEAVAALAEVIADLRVEFATLSGALKSMERLEQEIKDARDSRTKLEERLRTVEDWKLQFTGEKGVLDAQAEAATKFWRGIASALIIAMVLAVLGGGFAMYIQFQQIAALQSATQVMPAADGE